MPLLRPRPASHRCHWRHDLIVTKDRDQWFIQTCLPFFDPIAIRLISKGSNLAHEASLLGQSRQLSQLAQGMSPWLLPSALKAPDQALHPGQSPRSDVPSLHRLAHQPLRWSRRSHRSPRTRLRAWQPQSLPRR